MLIDCINVHHKNESPEAQDGKYKEIFKLHQRLEATGIPHTFVNDFEGQPFEKIGLCRYHIFYPSKANVICSVIEGYGTYGSEDDLLEIRGLLAPEEGKEGDVMGWLTAGNVYQRIQANWTIEQLDRSLQTILKEAEYDDSCLEREIEAKFTRELKKRNCLVYKFISPGNDGVPDRIVVTPSGRVLFVELKQKKGKLRATQRVQLRRLLAHRAYVDVLAGAADVDTFLKRVDGLEDGWG